MSALALLLCAMLSGSPQARLVLEPAEVEVGEPLTVRFELVHEASVRPALDPARLVPDESWAVLQEPRATRRRDAEGGGATTTFEFVVVSLEPGERTFPAPALRDPVEGLEVSPASVRVIGVLAAGEDEPRPWRGFRPPPRGVEPVPASRLLALLAAPLAVLLGAWLVRRRRRRQPPPAPEPSARERLAAAFAAAQASGDPAEVQRAFFELTRLLREAVAHRLERPDPPGLADDEWLAALRREGALPAPTLDALAALFEQAADVKYAGRVPTPFALAATREEAEACLAALAAEAAPRAQEAAA